MTHVARWIAGACLLSGAAVCPPAQAQVPCRPLAIGDAQLRERYGEVPVGAGVSNGRLVMLYTARDPGAGAGAGGSTWTIVIVDPARGVMCGLAAGDGWEDIEPPAAGDPA
ncbi:MAG: hypothetical protein RIB84_15740 [Sneathiellaceae bacterium]